MINYIRNLIHIRDVTIDCDIINNFEEKIKAFKSVKNYANFFINLLDEPYTNHLFFKQIIRKYTLQEQLLMIRSCRLLLCRSITEKTKSG